MRFKPFFDTLADKNGMDWAGGPMRVEYGLLVDYKVISSAQATKLRKVGNISTVIVRLKAVIEDTMLRLMIYTQAIK